MLWGRGTLKLNKVMGFWKVCLRFTINSRCFFFFFLSPFLMSWIYTPIEILNCFNFPGHYVLLWCLPWFQDGLGVYLIHNHEVIYENKCYNQLGQVDIIVSCSVLERSSKLSNMYFALMSGPLFCLETESVCIFF